MPVHGLWDALRRRGLLEEAENGEELRQLLQGKKVAVDLSIWVVEGETEPPDRGEGRQHLPQLLPPHEFLSRCAIPAVWVFAARCYGGRVPRVQGEAQRAGM